MKIDERLNEILDDFADRFDEDDSKYATGDHTHDENIAGKETMAIGFYCKAVQGELTGDTPTYVGDFPLSKYIQSAGHKVAFDQVAGTWTFTPSKEYDVVTITESVIDRDAVSGDGIEYRLAGGMSEMTLDAEGVRRPFKFNFTIRGQLVIKRKNLRCFQNHIMDNSGYNSNRINCLYYYREHPDRLNCGRF